MIDLEQELEERMFLGLQYIENQTPEICLAAVQQYGMSLKYVNEQTPEICLAAVQQDYQAIRQLKDEILKSLKNVLYET